MRVNFGTMTDRHNGREISKNRQWEIHVTFKKIFEFLNFDLKYLKKCPEKFLRFLAKSTTSGVANTNMAEYRNRK